MPLYRNLIYIDDKDITFRVKHFRYEGDKCIVVYNNGSKEYAYSRERARIVSTALSEDNAFGIFKYLKDTAEVVGRELDENNNILARSYQSIEQIPEESVLSCYLNGTLPSEDTDTQKIDLFPFGFNTSQKAAVNLAFSKKLSVIEGPPGTGKTQTILNIIANAVMNGHSVAIVSSNNAAIQNVYDKLEKNGLEFLAALLGKSQNKKDFIENQKSLPHLSEFYLAPKKYDRLQEKAIKLSSQLTDYLEKKNKSARLKMELENIITEYQHFQKVYKEPADSSIIFKKNLRASSILEFWVSIENLARRGKRIDFIKRILFWLKFGIKNKEFFLKPLEEIIFISQSKYYQNRISEINHDLRKLEMALNKFSFDQKMESYTAMSMQLFKAVLCNKYKTSKRKVYSIEELRSKSADFVLDYPVILSTTYSLRLSLSNQFIYDYVIIDEASQADIVTGALALSCAKRAVIVGDNKQLPNVITKNTKTQVDPIFKSYHIKECYRYSTQSLLSSLQALFPEIPKTLLQEHYRCHPKIIEFCNQKFYNNELIILTEHSQNGSPLLIYKTVAGNHARGNLNQRQIDTIKDEIIPREKLYSLDMGIVTPYRAQTNALQLAFKDTNIKADTVDKFQGRENKIIILSTVDNEISEFTDNPNRLNVAVSRAIDQLIIVVNGNEDDRDSNISDLIQYAEYQNFTVVHSELNSVFDLLYKGFEAERNKFISKSGRVSEFESENLMYGLIKEVLSNEKFLKYDVLTHFPLRNLIRDFSLLEEEESNYAKHPFTHLDFLIYNKLGKVPVLGIEVDGFSFHQKGSLQAERDQMKDTILKKFKFPVLRFSTTGSNERKKLESRLLRIQDSKLRS